MTDRRSFFSEALLALGRFGFDCIEETSLGKGIDQLIEQGRKKERPPGAVEETLFRSLCTGCDRCMAACPVNIIFIDDLEKRLPIIYSEETPCIQCSDTPCIRSCPTGALSLQMSMDKEVVDSA